MTRTLKCLPLLLLACGPVQVGGDLEVSSGAALKDLDPPGGGTGGGGIIGPSQACGDVCTPQSRCDQSCGANASSTCGAFGVCVSCATACTSTSPCGTVCLSGTTITQCSSAGAECQSCSAATCEAMGCSALCQQPQQLVIGKLGFPTPLPRTYQRCDAYGATINDKDSDGLDDDFELRLAKQFFPNVNMPYWSEFQFYGAQSPEMLCTGPLCRLPIVVRKAAPLTGSRWGWCATGQCVEIIYGLPYNWDTGDPDAPGSLAHSHQGDAEFVATLVAHRRADDEADGADWGVPASVALSDPSAWRMVAGFWAAHYGAGSFAGADVDSSRYVFPRTGGTYSGTKLMNVYVAEGKHASYPTSSECDNGGWLNSDSCAGGRFLDRALLQSRLVNVGDEHGDLTRPGWVCAGFERHIAAPASTAADAPVTVPPHDVWSGAQFDSTTTWFGVLHRSSRNWGNDYVTYVGY